MKATEKATEPLTKEEQLQKALGVISPDAVGPFRDADHTLYCRLRIGQHHEHHTLTSDFFNRWVTRGLRNWLGFMPPVWLVRDVVRSYEGIAEFDGPVEEVHLRTAPYANGFVIDLCDADWNAVTVSPDGWATGASPVRFRRTDTMRALPWPASGGKLRSLSRFLNLSREQELLALCWLLSALRASDTYPILVAEGVPGAAKSTLCKVLRALVDPSRTPLSTFPRNERDLAISARHSHLLIFDNLSKLTNSQSDWLSRLSLGAGLSTRRLHTDEKLISFYAARPLAYNSIAAITTRGDLLDRIVRLRVEAIQPEERKANSDFWVAFDAAKAQIFGALLDVLVETLRREPQVKLLRPERMADFCRLGIAAEKPLGFQDGAFMAAYKSNRRENSLHSLDSSPAAAMVRRFMEGQDSWTGSCAELLVRLEKMTTTDQRDSSWPKSARGMAEVLARSELDLKVACITITRLAREGGTGVRRIRLDHTVTSSRHTAETHKHRVA